MVHTDLSRIFPTLPLKGGSCKYLTKKVSDRYYSLFLVFIVISGNPLQNLKNCGVSTSNITMTNISSTIGTWSDISGGSCKGTSHENAWCEKPNKQLTASLSIRFSLLLLTYLRFIDSFTFLKKVYGTILVNSFSGIGINCSRAGMYSRTSFKDFT